MAGLRTARWTVLVLAVLAPGLAAPATQAQQGDPWPTKAHDARRTGQSRHNGPLAIDPARSWTVPLPGAHTVNIGATVTERGVFFASWGLLRRPPGNPDPRFWDKADGQFFGHDLDTGAALWGGPLDLDLVPRCYDFPGRGPNLFWCGLTPYEVSFYNGTVEGQAAFDAGRNVLYAGRGDGRLFAIDPDEGRILWRFVTFNPQLPDDPDGGGEVVTAPLLGPDGTVYFGTWGEGPYETDAFYAVNPDSTLQWRYPTGSSLTHRIFASPALSPDAATVYVSTFLDDDARLPASLYAFHREPTGPVPDDERLKWALEMTHQGRPVWTTTLAVGSDGVVYVGGFFIEGNVNVPVLAAVVELDLGNVVRPSFLWTPSFVELRDGAQFVLGVALRETEGETRRLYVATANLRTFNQKQEGELHTVDPATGAVLASYDPSDDVPAAIGSLNSPAIGADGTVYFGVRGRFGNNPVNGHYFAVTYDADAARFERLWNVEVEGLIEWNHPAIGPDGGLYAGSSSHDEQARGPTYEEGATPEGTTAFFHAIKGPTTRVATDPPAALPAAFGLAPAFPNPFAHATTLEVQTPQAGAARVQIFDLLGRAVRTLADEHLPAGRRTLTWDGADDAGRPLAGGVYFARLLALDGRTGQAHTATQKIVLLRQGR